MQTQQCSLCSDGTDTLKQQRQGIRKRAWTKKQQGDKHRLLMWCCGAIISHPVFRENSVKVTREQGAEGVGCVVGDRAEEEHGGPPSFSGVLTVTHSDGFVAGDTAMGLW